RPEEASRQRRAGRAAGALPALPTDGEDLGGVDALPAAVRIRVGFLHVLGGHWSAAARRHPLPKPGALLHGHVRFLPCPDGRLAVRGRATAGDAEAAAGGAAVAIAHLVRQNGPVLRLVGRTGT